MAQIMSYARYLAKEIGPRPAGTEEEQQASLYITEQFQKEAGFTASIEEFANSANPGLSTAIYSGLVVVVSIVSIIFPEVAIAAFVLAAAAAVLYTLELLDRPMLSRVLPHGASQNVIAKYQPNPDEEAAGRMRSRKLILVAHYDTGRTTPALVQRAEATNLPLTLISLVGMGASAFFLLLRVFIATSGGMGLIVLNVLSVVALLAAVLPLVKFVLMRLSPYNEGANNNATGTAALIDIARRINRGSVSEADLVTGEDDVTIHGEAAARSEGLIPEGAQILYEAEQLAPPAELGEYDEEERLLAAKAAIAALTGKPVERHVYGSVADKLVNSRVHDDAPVDDMPQPMEPLPYAGRQANPNAPVEADYLYQPVQEEEPPAIQTEGFKNAPSWFVAAQKNARRSTDGDSESQIHRSRFTEAMEHAERERQQREQEIQRAEQERQEAERLAREEEARNVLEQRMGAPVDASGAFDALDAGGAGGAFDAGGAGVDVAGVRTGGMFDQNDDLIIEPFGGQRVRLSQPGAEVAAAPAAGPAGGAASADGAAADVEAAPAPGVETAPAPAPGVEAAPGPATASAPVDALREDEQQMVNPDQTHAFPGYAQIDAAAAAQAAQAAQAGEAGFADGPLEAAEIDAVPRRSITLPELDPARPGAHAKVNDLPSIESAPAPSPSPSAAPAPAPSADAQGNPSDSPSPSDSSRSDRLRNLRTSVPSLSGVIRTQNEARKAVASSLPSVVNVPTPAQPEAPASEPARVPAADPASAPAPARRAVASEPEEAVDYDMEVPDQGQLDLGADDAFAAPEGAAFDDYSDDYDDYDGFDDDGYDDFAEGDGASVDMPASRSKGFLNRFRRRGADELEETPQEWLNIDDDFDARSVGRARGGWESFRNESQDFDAGNASANASAAPDAEGRPAPRRGWEGGGYSRMSLGYVNMRSGADTEADEAVVVEPPEDMDERAITGEIEQIYHFRNPAFNTEIWFVAIGSDNDLHEGARAFIEEHQNELRGSTVIEVESLGAGTLSVASQEGKLRKVNASSRIKRITRGAVSKTGISPDNVSLAGTDSISSVMQKAGYQAMHIFGAEDGRPALKGSADDVLENIDEYLLDEHVNFLFELLKYR